MHAALGVYAAGGVIVPLNTRFKGAEAAYILDRAKAKLLFTVTDFLDTDYVELLRAAEPVASLEQIVVLRGAPAAERIGWAEFLARAEQAPASEVAARSAALTGDSLSDILFTSGTTGRPKGAMLTHGASVQAYDAWSTVVGLRPGDRYLVVNPFFHAFGLKAGILASLIKGATIIPHAVFNVDTVMQRVADEHVSMLPGPPTVYQSILDHPRRRRVRPLVVAPRGHRRGAGVGRADPAHARRAEVRDRRDRLRAHRGNRHRHDVPPRRRPRDDLEDRGPGDPRHRGARRRRRRRGRCPPASPAKS